MNEPLQIFQTANAMARHAGQRQALTAQNVANSDTPGYVARTMASFSESYQSSGPVAIRATRTGHLTQVRASGLVADGTSEPSPNGNSVSIEEEMFRAVEISREHNRAITIYRHAMTILKVTLGRS